MASQALIGSTYTGSLASGTRFFSPWEGRILSNTSVAFAGVASAASTFSNLFIELSAAPGTGITRTYTLMVNGSATALTCSISNAATAASDTTHTVSVSAGDLVTIQQTVTGGSAALSAVTFYIESDAGTSSLYGGSRSLNSTLTRWIQALWTGTAQLNATENLVSDLIGADGNLTAFYVNLSVAPGAGTSWTFNLVKNGTVQDGSGATVNTTVTISNTATTGNASFTLPVAPGDVISMQSVATGAPATTGVLRNGIAFTPTTAGQFQLGGMYASTTGSSGTNYAALRGDINTAWSGTEADTQIKWLGTLAATFNGMQAVDVTAPGNARVYAFRRNGADVLTATVPGAGTSGSGQGSVTLAQNDLLNWSQTLTGSSGGVTRIKLTLNAAVAAVLLLPSAGSMSISGAAPIASIGRVYLPSVGALAFTGLAPGVANGLAFTPADGSLTLIGAAPSLNLTLADAVPVGTITLTGLAATVIATTNSFPDPAAGSFSFSGLAPRLFMPASDDFAALLLY